MKLEDLSKPAIFAHRGASAYAPENTLAAFELAVQQGATAIELDAKLSLDEHVVVIHDQTVDRTTSSSGRVAKMRLEELRRLDAGSHFDISFAGEKIPTLSEVFEFVGQRTFINVELTNYDSPFSQLPQKVAELVNKHNLSMRVIFSSFNPVALLRIHRMVPSAPIGLLALPGQAGSWARSWLGRMLIPYQSLHPEVGDAHTTLIETSHQHGRSVFVYTVNLEEDMLRLYQSSVDGIFSDDPVLALKTLQSLDKTTQPSYPDGEMPAIHSIKNNDSTRRSSSSKSEKVP
jgi:glycerophosphoryl diester phosphodiesterase